MKKLHRRTPVVFYVGCALLCLALFSANLTSGLYARYTSTASGSDSARVARFDVNNTVQSGDASIHLHFFDASLLSDEVTFTVTSSSEVAVGYSVTVTMPTSDPYSSWLDVTLGDSTPTSRTDNSFTFSNVAYFEPNDGRTHEHSLFFKIKDESVGKPGSLRDVSGNVVITVRAEQID